MMGLRDLTKRMQTSPEQLESQRLRDRCANLDVISIAQLEFRVSARVAGEVKRIMVAPRKGIPALEVVLSDGTGDAVAVFTGRRHIAGLEHGRAVIIEGVAHDERGRRVMLNPAYTLIAG